MEGLTELIPFLVKDGDSLLWNDFLKSCKELRVFVKKPNESVPLINSLLNEHESRLHGLRLLELFLGQSSKDTVSEHIVHWFHQCLKGIAQPSASVQSSLSYLILCSLLETSKEFPDVRKQTSQVFISKILDSIIERNKDGSQNSIPMLKCLHACLLHYGKSCGNHKDTIEGMLVKLLNSDCNMTHYVAKCFHLLAQCGAPGTEFINYKQSWESQHLIVINSLHSILDQLYCDVNEILGTYNMSVNEKRKLEIPSVTEKYPLLRYHKLNRIFSCLCQVLENMLLDGFPTCKKMHPEAILGVICRSLAVTCKALETKISVSTYSLMAQLCDVHISAIKLLNSLILSARTNLLPFSSLITNLFIQIFKWTYTEDWPYGKERPFLAVRRAGYKCLLTWLSVGKSCSFTENQINIIVEAVLKDIKCDKKNVSLNLEKKTSKTKSTKKITIDASGKVEMNAETCCSALSCIPSLLRVPVSSSVVKNFQEVVVKLLFEIQRSLRCGVNFPPPYSKPNCRAQLYSVLLALCVSPHPQFPPPLHYANLLFHAASSDDSIEVTTVCSQAVISISHMLRPCAPSFDFHADLDSEIIPINVNPDPSYKEIKAISKRARQARYTSKMIDGNAKHQNEVTSDTDNDLKQNKESEIIISDVCTLGNNNINENGSDDLIDLADSSDESLILVDSNKKSDICDDVVNTSKGNSELNSLDNSKVKTYARRATRRKDGNDGSSNLSKDDSEGVCTLELHKCSKSTSDKSDNGDSCILDEVSIVSHEEIILPHRTTLSKAIADDITSQESDNVDRNPKLTEKQNSFENNTIKSLSDSPKRERRSIRTSKTGDTKGTSSMSSGETVISEELSIIETAEVSSSRRLTRSKVTDISDNQDNSAANSKSNWNNTAGYETKISEDVSIIEVSDPSSPLRRSKRNGGSSPYSSSNEVNKNSTLRLNDEVTIINDEEEPPSKRLRSFNTSSKQEKTDGHVQNILTDDSIALNEGEEDDEMLTSFVDSVPD